MVSVVVDKNIRITERFFDIHYKRGAGHDAHTDRFRNVSVSPHRS
jgi:hypothetical protein